MYWSITIQPISNNEFEVHGRLQMPFYSGFNVWNVKQTLLWSIQRVLYGISCLCCGSTSLHCDRLAGVLHILCIWCRAKPQTARGAAPLSPHTAFTAQEIASYLALDFSLTNPLRSVVYICHKKKKRKLRLYLKKNNVKNLVWIGLCRSSL